MTRIINKKKPCSICGKNTYGKRCNSCEAKLRIEKARKNKKVIPKKTPTKVTPKVVKKKKGNKVGVIKKHCSDLHSVYVRLRDSGKDGFGSCITCERRCFFYNDCFDAGHMFSRRLMSVHYDDRNVNSQCKGCNGPGNGQQFEYGIAVDKKWGVGTAQNLLEMSRKIKKFLFIDYEDILKRYLPLCYDLLEQKEIDSETYEKVKSRLDFYKRYLLRINAT